MPHISILAIFRLKTQAWQNMLVSNGAGTCAHAHARSVPLLQTTNPYRVQFGQFRSDHGGVSEAPGLGSLTHRPVGEVTHGDDKLR